MEGDGTIFLGIYTNLQIHEDSMSTSNLRLLEIHLQESTLRTAIYEPVAIRSMT